MDILALNVIELHQQKAQLRKQMQDLANKLLESESAFIDRVMCWYEGHLPEEMILKLDSGKHFIVEFDIGSSTIRSLREINCFRVTTKVLDFSEVV